MTLTLVQQTYKEIFLSNDDRVAIVDACDYKDLTQYDWYLFERSGRRPKAVRLDDEAIRFLHHEILRLRGIDFQRVQHINGNALDNRFANLHLTPLRERKRKQVEEFKEIDLNVGRLLNRFEKIISFKIRHEIESLKSQRLKIAFMLQEVIFNVESSNEVQIKGQLEQILRSLQP
jgi:hypothetical protein